MRQHLLTPPPPAIGDTGNTEGTAEVKAVIGGLSWCLVGQDSRDEALVMPVR